MRFRLPDRSFLLRYLADCGASYWRTNESLVLALNVPSLPVPGQALLRYTEFLLPLWAEDLGVQGRILVPLHCVEGGPGGPSSSHEGVDWWQAAFLMISCWDEVQWEIENGPAHSYAYRLKALDGRVWERAWVNRIFLFLRRWAARIAGKDEKEVFGDLPEPEIIMTHDIDAISKTLAIRSKGLVFAILKTIQLLCHAEFRESCKRLERGVQFFFSRADYWCFPRIRELEHAHGVSSRFYVYAGSRDWKRIPTRLIFDPGYRISHDRRLADQIRALRAEGCGIGLHQSFDAWANAEVMKSERLRLESTIGFPVTSCRQHWLRFSMQRTWREQVKAGFQEDYTLGFNDRPAFRNAAALRVRPWCYEDDHPYELTSLSLVMMDSQLYEYEALDEEARYSTMVRWVQEIKDVRGVASVLWHQQVLGADYNWDQGLQNLLALIK